MEKSSQNESAVDANSRISLRRDFHRFIAGPSRVQPEEMEHVLQVEVPAGTDPASWDLLHDFAGHFGPVPFGCY